MSSWKFKDIRETQDVVILSFNDSAHPPWGDEMSVTIPVAEATKLLAKLEATLHPHVHSKH